MEITKFREQLPIFQFKDKLVEKLKTNDFLIITGETGSGKTTQLPQYVVDCMSPADLNSESAVSVCITQPRRVAAIQMAKRVASERRTVLGREVGYSIRFEEKSNNETRIKFVTDGILVRECLGDKDLSRYNVIILDEAHERSLYTDILFALCKEAVKRRKGSLKLIVTSATLDTKQFSDFFEEAAIFSVEGRSFPVEVSYFPSRMEKRVDQAVRIAIRIHLHEDPGHILVFLTGFEECEQACKLCFAKLNELSSQGKQVGPLMIMPLYGAQNTEDQAKIFEPAPENSRKLIFSTNIAETSLTVDGIGYVIDCGFVKQKVYNPRTSMDTLSIVPVSVVQAIQRAGRAGRTGPGKCIRLYTSQFFSNQMPKSSVPEIMRVNLSSTIVTLKSMGIDICEFDFIEKPSTETIKEAFKLLYFLRAVDRNSNLTGLGKNMAKFPLDSCYTRALLASKLFGIEREMVLLVSLVSVESLWFNVNKYDEERRLEFEEKRRSYADEQSDHMAILNIFKEWENSGFNEQWCRENFLHFRALRQASNVADQITEILNRVNFKECEQFFSTSLIRKLVSKVDNTVESVYERVSLKLRMALSQGFYMNCAKKSVAGLETVYNKVRDGTTVSLDINCGCAKKKIKPNLLIFTELGGSSTKAVMKSVSEIEPMWIADLLPFLKDFTVHTKEEKDEPEEEILMEENQELVEEDFEDKIKEKIAMREKAAAARERYLQRKRATNN